MIDKSVVVLFWKALAAVLQVVCHQRDAKLVEAGGRGAGARNEQGEWRDG